MAEIGQPIYLLAALGVAVPILIHLWNKKPPRVVQVGSIRWFRGSVAPSAHRLQLKDIPLLLLRCLLLLVFSLLLAGLWGEAEEVNRKNFQLWLTQPELAGQFPEKRLDSLQEEGIRLRLLAPGLPEIKDSASWKDRPVDIWAVMKEADRLPGAGDTIRIISRLLQGSFSGSRPALQRQYLFVEPEKQLLPEKTAAGIVLWDSLSVVQQWVLEEGGVKFTSDTLPSEQRIKKTGVDRREMEAIPPDTFSIRFEAEEAYQKDAQNLRVALELAAAQIPGLTLENRSKEDDAKVDLLVWLRADSLPDNWQNMAKQALKGATGKGFGDQWLHKAEPEKQVYQLTERPVFGEVERDKLQRLPLALMSIFSETKLEEGAALLPMPLHQAAPTVNQSSVYEVEEKRISWHNWLWILLMGLFLIERIWVYLK